MTIMRYVRGLLKSVPMLKQLIETERVESIELSNRITIEIHTASFRTTRGYTIVAANGTTTNRQRGPAALCRLPGARVRRARVKYSHQSNSLGNLA